MVQKILVASVKTVIPRKVLLFFRKISTGMNRSIWILPGISGFTIQMVSTPYVNLTATMVDALLKGTPCYKGNYWALAIYVENPERSVIRDHSDHGRSNEPMNPCPEWIHRFIWLATMIRVISDHWSRSASSQRIKLTVELVWHRLLARHWKLAVQKVCFVIKL